MSYNLLIRLKKDANQSLSTEWLIIYDHGEIRLGTDSAADSDLAKSAGFAQNIIVLVPSTDLLLTSTKLPKLSQSRLIKALPFALEDQLSEDTQMLHFATGAFKHGEPLPVAVVSKEKMTEWLTFLSKRIGKASALIKAIIPDALALSFKPDSFQIYMDEQFALTRTRLCSAFAIEKDDLFPLLQLTLNQWGQPKPAAINLYQPLSMILLSDEQIKELNVPVTISEPPKNILSAMADVFNQPETINLLQGEYAPTQEKATLNQLIWAGFAVVSIWLVFVTIVNIFSYAILYNEKRTIDSTMQVIYKKISPNSPLSKNPKVSLQNELNNLRANRASSAFIRLLDIIGSEYVPLRNNGITLNKITYRNNQLILDIEAKNLQLLDKFRIGLEAHGLDVVVSNAERNQVGLIEMHFTVKEITS